MRENVRRRLALLLSVALLCTSIDSGLLVSAAEVTQIQEIPVEAVEIPAPEVVEEAADQEQAEPVEMSAEEEILLVDEITEVPVKTDAGDELILDVSTEETVCEEEEQMSDSAPEEELTVSAISEEVNAPTDTQSRETGETIAELNVNYIGCIPAYLQDPVFFLTITYASGETYRSLIGLSVCSFEDSYGNTIEWTISNGNGDVLTDVYALPADSYTLRMSCDTANAICSFEVKAIEEILEGTLVPGENTITAGTGTYTSAYLYYKLIPETTGKHYINSIGYRSVLTEENGVLKEVSLDTELQAGKTYYVGFAVEDDSYVSQTVTVGVVPAVTGITVTPKKSVYVLGQDSYIGCDVTFTYGDSEPYTGDYDQYSSPCYICDNYGNNAELSLRNAAGDLVTDTNSLSVGSYAIRCAYGEMQSEGTFEIKKLSEVALGELKPGENSIQASGYGYYYYRFVPDTTGKYIFTNSLPMQPMLQIAQEAEDGSLSGIQYGQVVELEANEVYYVGCCSTYSGIDMDGTVTVNQVPDLTSITVQPSPATYVAGGSDAISGNVMLRYADGEESIYSLGGLSGGGCDRYGNEFVVSATDAQGAAVELSPAKLAAGAYTITVSCGEVTGSASIEVCAFEDLLKGTLVEGRNEISLGEGEMGYYQFVPSSTGRYLFTGGVYVNCYVRDDSGALTGADLSKLEAGTTYYVSLNPYGVCNEITVTKVQKITSVSVATSKDVYYAGVDGYVCGDITVTYEDGRTKTFFISSGYIDEYGHYLRFALKKTGETEGPTYDSELSGLEPGNYQVFCVYDGGTSQEQTIEVKAISEAPSLTLGTQTVEVGTYSDPTYYQFTPENEGSYVLDGEQQGFYIYSRWYTASETGLELYKEVNMWPGSCNAITLTAKQTYYVKMFNYAENSSTNTLRIRKQQEITAIQAEKPDLKETYIQGLDEGCLYEGDFSKGIVVTFTDGTTEKLEDGALEDSYGHSLEVHLYRDDVEVSIDDCLDTPGTYVCKIGYGDIQTEVTSFQVASLKDAGLSEAEENQETVVQAEGNTAVFKFVSGQAGTYEIEANVPIEYLTVYDDNLVTMRGIRGDGGYKAYAKLEAQKAYYFKSELSWPYTVTRLKVICRPVTLPQKAELRASGTLIAGLDYLDNVTAKVTYDNHTTGTIYGPGDDFYGNKFRYTVEDAQGTSWDYGERVKAGTYTVDLQVFRTGSSISEQLEGIQTTPVTVEVEDLQTSALPVIEKDAWVTVNPTGNRQLFAFTAPEKGTYQLEGDVNYYLAEFYSQEDQQWVHTGYTVALEAGETCVIATNGFTAGQFRVVAASEDTPTGGRKTVALETGKSYEAQLNDNIQYIDYVFTPTETKSYWIKASSSAYTDTYVTLYCGDEVIDEDDDSANEGSFYLRHTLEAGKTYRYEVRMYSPGTEGNATVEFEEFQSKAISDIEVIQVGDLLNGAGMSGPYEGLAMEITYADGTKVRLPWRDWGNRLDEYGNLLTCCENETTEELQDGSGYKQGFYVEYRGEGETETKTSETTVFEIRYMTSVAEELQQGIPVTKTLAAGKTAYFKFKPAEEGIYLISAKAEGVNISSRGSSEAYNPENWYEQGKYELWMSADYDGYETFWFSCTDDEGNSMAADLTVEIRKAKDITDLTVLTKPATEKILEHSGIYSYEGLTVKARYADGTEETIGCGETDSSGRELQYYGTWINDQTFRVYVSLGVYRTYYDVPAKSWDEAPKLQVGEAVQVGEAGNPSAGATFTPEAEGNYQIAVTNGTENESYSIAVREKESDELISTVNGTYVLAEGTCYKVSLYRSEMNESGEPIGPRPGIFEVTVYVAGECLWEVTDEKAATCTEAGYVKKHCKVHGDDVTEVLPATGHSFGEWTETAAPDCAADGAKIRTCSTCQATETQVIPALGHIEKTETKEATCTEDGYNRTICTRCKEVLSETIREATGHSFGEWDVRKEATCTEAGQQTRKCSKCNLAEDWTMPVLGHIEKTETKEATCTEDGYTRIICTRCNVTISEELQKATNHAYGQWLVTKAATCTEAGEQVKICSRCQNKQTEVIPASGHTEKTETLAATCTADGYTRTVCEICGAILSTEEIKATGHSWNEERVEPTCTVNGYERRTCGNCGVLEETPLEALGHDWRWVVTKEPTETEKGERQQICSRCKEVQATEEIDATHEHVWVEDKKEATCTEAGYTQMVCSGCQAVQADSRTETVALGHNWGEWTVAEEATCTQEGRNERVCSTCGEKQEETIPVKVHTWEITVMQEPTCTQEGQQSEICTVCGTGKEGSEKTLPMLAHTWAKEMTVDKAANCTEKGSRSIHCTVCGSVLENSQIEIPALGHDIQQIVTIPSTCYAEGQVTTYCKNRGCTMEPKTVALSRLDHQMIPDSEIPANCEEDGLRTWICSIQGCGRKTYEVIPALGHDYSSEEETSTSTGSERVLVIKRCIHNGCDSYQTVRVLPSEEEQGIMTVLQDSVRTAGSDSVSEDEKTEAIAAALTAIAEVDNEVLTGVQADENAGTVSGTALVQELETQIKAADTSISETVISDEDNVDAVMEAVGMAITVAKEIQSPKPVMRLSLMSAENDLPVATAEDAVYTPSLRLGTGVPGKDAAKGQIYTDKVITAYVKQGADERAIERLAAPVTIKGLLLPDNYGTETKAYLVADGKETALKTTITGNIMEVVLPQLGTLRLRNDCAHEWPSTWNVDQQASCTEGGLESQSCDICGKSQTRKTETSAHNFQSKVTKKATCTEVGEVTLTCSACGASETNAIPVNNNHTWSEWTMETQATCSTDGTETRTCSLCNKAEETRAIPAGGADSSHTALPETWTTEKEATCTETGMKYKICAACGTKVTEDIPKLDHEYGEWKVTKAATCTANGLEERECVKCGEKETRETAATGHIYDGAWTVVIAATCTANGLEERKCVNCDQKETRETGAIGHIFDGAWTVTSAATCTANGVQERKCRNCDQKETQAIPAIGHNYSSAWTTDRASTCTAEGSKSRHCTRCSAVTDVTRIPVTGHMFGEFIVTAEPTALASGTETRKCSACGASESRATSKLPATMTLTANSLPMKTKQTTTLFKVSDMAQGDYLTSVVSSNTKLLKVSNVERGGTFKLAAQKKTGKVTLTITLASGLSRNVAVKIQKGKVKTTAIQTSVRSLTLQKGKKATVKAVVSPVTSQDKVSFTSSNKKVATVSSKGVITAKKAGTAKITVKAGSKKAVITVKVQGVKTTDLTGVPASKTLKKGKKLTLKVKRVPAASEDKITYASSNKKVATITSKGKITAKKPGTTVITVKAGDVVKRFTLTVTK